MKKEEILANLKCFHCDHIMKVEIPQKGCLVFHQCEKCQEMIITPESECCVICAYSDKKCPVKVNKK